MTQLTTGSLTQKPATRILGIAPYEGMKTIMQKLAASRGDLHLDVYVGDLQQGVELVKRNADAEYDVIISRGGTARLIRQMTRIPVVEVSLSVYDILRAIKLSENYAGRYAIVGYPNITSNAHLLCDLLQYRIDIFTIQSHEEVSPTLSALRNEGYKMVLCDMIAHTTAKRLGLNTILITSGAESISAAFDQAVKLNTAYQSLLSEKRFFAELLRSGEDDVIVLKENGELFFSTVSEEAFSKPGELLSKELPAVLDGRMQKFFKNINGSLYAFTCRAIPLFGERYAAFYFSPNSVPLGSSKYGIKYSDQQEAQDLFFNSFFSITNSASNIRTIIENLNQTNFPVMISGEAGSGKEQAARMIYSASSLCVNPLITVNCTLLSERSWNFLTNHYNSPFNDNNNTIYISEINALSQERCSQLLSIIVDTNLHKRNRLIFSYSCPMGQGLSPQAMEFVNLLSCVTVHLPPLREHTSEIPALASLYLNTINVSMTNQIIGLEPGAIELLQKYSWPYNYTQFKRILRELALVTTTPYISTEHAAALLEKEKEPGFSPIPSAFDGQNTSHLLDLNRPLSDITQEIIHLVLDDVGGNQSAAAKRLGIGRSTLWRYLK